MQSDTNPLPAAQLMALADAAIRLGRVARNLRNMHDNDGRGTSEIRRENAANKSAHDAEKAYRAARAASPVTLEEHLLVAVRVAHKKFMDGIDLRGEKQGNWSSKTMSNERAFHDAEKARDEHARRLAGEGGGQ